MVCFRFKLWWMAHKMGGKGGHGSHETQLLLVESKDGVGVLSGEEYDASYVRSVPPARGVRAPGQPRGWRRGQRRASALRPELRRRHARQFFAPLGRRWLRSVYGDGVASSALFLWLRFCFVSQLSDYIDYARDEFLKIILGSGGSTAAAPATTEGSLLVCSTPVLLTSKDFVMDPVHIPPRVILDAMLNTLQLPKAVYDTQPT